ncbi:MAG: hypothetical protein QOG83_3464 [Alphaproteobacteria bacterium]|nr:hypothetical protein [Alphaproteobacteria bacterium]
MPRPRATIFPMKPNVPRILAAISYVIDQARRRDQRVTQYEIVKTIFLADRASLNKFGRPITFDNYAAMKDGPVPSTSYNFLKGDANALRRHKVAVPWRSVPAPEYGARAKAFEIPEDKVRLDALSPSDIEELADALTIVKALGFAQVKKLTHDDPAYVEAWDGEGDATSYSMSYSLLFDIPNEELARELSFLSKHV